jgi:hypothetical protein
VNEFHAQCDPNKENLCLYGRPDGTWRVELPAEEVPPELPEPALGVNFARDGMAVRARGRECRFPVLAALPAAPRLALPRIGAAAWRRRRQQRAAQSLRGARLGRLPGRLPGIGSLVSF